MHVFVDAWNAEATIKALALLGAAAAFLMGLFQYRKAQRWKRAEWVAQEMKHFLGDPLVRSALALTDWGGRRVVLGARLVDVSCDEVTQALEHSTSECEQITEKEAAICDAFDQLCDGLERFESYVASGLVSVDDLDPYLKYWGQRLRPDADEIRFRRVRKYMKAHDFEGAGALLDRFAPPK